MVETRVPVVEFTTPASAAMVEYIAHVAVVYVCTGEQSSERVAGCLLVMQAVLFFDFGSRTECLRRRFGQSWRSNGLGVWALRGGVQGV